MRSIEKEVRTDFFGIRIHNSAFVWAPKKM